MKTVPKWKRLLITLSLLPLLSAGCTTAVRDAIQGGALDFVSGTVTELLSRLFPVPDVAAES